MALAAGRRRGSPGEQLQRVVEGFLDSHSYSSSAGPSSDGVEGEGGAGALAAGWWRPVVEVGRFV